MGLSDEERLDKFFYTIMAWRGAVVKLHDATPKEKRKIVRSWISRIDDLVGMQIVKQGRNSAYWITGPNKSNFGGLLERGEVRFGNESKAEPGSFAANASQVDYSFIAYRYSGWDFTEDAGVSTLAQWWDQYGWVDALIYPIYRYDDKLFSKAFHTKFLNLVGEMANLRFEICGGIGNLQCELLARLETCLLLKSKLIHLRLDEEEKNLRDPGKAPVEAPKFEDSWENKIYKLVSEVGHMSISVVTKILAEESEKREKRYERRENEEKKPTLSGVLGPPPRSKEVLDKIIEEGTDRAEVEQAVQDMDCFYGILCGGWEHRFDTNEDPT